MVLRKRTVVSSELGTLKWFLCAMGNTAQVSAKGVHRGEAAHPSHLLGGHFEFHVLRGHERFVLVEDAAEEHHEQAETRALRKVITVGAGWTIAAFASCVDESRVATAKLSPQRVGRELRECQHEVSAPRTPPPRGSAPPA